MTCLLGLASPDSMGSMADIQAAIPPSSRAMLPSPKYFISHQVEFGMNKYSLVPNPINLTTINM